MLAAENENRSKEALGIRVITGADLHTDCVAIFMDVIIDREMNAWSVTEFPTPLPAPCIFHSPTGSLDELVGFRPQIDAEFLDIGDESVIAFENESHEVTSWSPNR